MKYCGFVGFRKRISGGMSMKTFIRKVLDGYDLPRSSTSGNVSQLLLLYSPNAQEGPKDLRIRKPLKKEFFIVLNTQRGQMVRLRTDHVSTVSKDVHGRKANGETCWLCGPRLKHENLSTQFKIKSSCLECHCPYLSTKRHYTIEAEGTDRIARQSCIDYFPSIQKLEEEV